LAGEKTALDQDDAQLTAFFTAARDMLGSEIDVDPVRTIVAEQLSGLTLKSSVTPKVTAAIERYSHGSLDHILRLWTLIRNLGHFAGSDDDQMVRDLSIRLYDEWFLRKAIRDRLQQNGVESHIAGDDSMLIRILLDLETSCANLQGAGDAHNLFTQLLESGSVRTYVRVNEYEEAHWLNKEQLERLFSALLAVTTVRLHWGETKGQRLPARALETVEHILTGAAESGYQIEKTIQLLEPATKPG
jgi:hypothetical protein